MTPTIYTIPEACQMLRVSRDTLYRMWKAGTIGCVKIGRHTYVPVSEIERLTTTLSTYPQQSPVGEPVGIPAKTKIQKVKLTQVIT